MASRILQVLGLFRLDPGPWTVEAIAREMDVSQSSAYRDVQELSRFGFLDPVTGAGYVLGPAFIEYDRLSRQGDTLLKVAAPALRHLLETTTQSATAIICRRYRDMVMCVHQEAGLSPHPFTAYERGVAMPLFAGASSKVVLAHLDDRSLKRIYLDNAATIRERLGYGDWKAFKDQLRAIRKAGVVETASEVAEGRVGIAAPVFAEGQVVAGVSLVFNAADVPIDAVPGFRAAVMAVGDAISRRIAEGGTWIAR
ncbi:IclR family transcriptional regulator C-terminal domain-containing protein [Azorhizobium sp. AG788]|uniref:IclR family transcriptional regulator n=1 Tax=Azorhizobium sp. AG788 TaxID=2183897 RepID=UPI00313908B4